MSRRLLLMPSVHRPPIAATPTAPTARTADDEPLDDDLGRYRRPAFQPGADDEALLALLTRPPAAPSVAASFALLEARVRTRLQALSPRERYQLRQRLAAPHPDDHVVAALARLTGERRARIATSLAIMPLAA